MEWIDGIRCTDPVGIRASGMDVAEFIRCGVVTGLRQLLEVSFPSQPPTPATCPLAPVLGPCTCPLHLDTNEWKDFPYFFFCGDDWPIIQDNSIHLFHIVHSIFAEPSRSSLPSPPLPPLPPLHGVPAGLVALLADLLAYVCCLSSSH